jgi:3-deoxy-D-manno-octulosonic-acid transferase
MRKVYSLITYLIAPLLPLYLKKRGKKNPAYLANWHERFAWKLTNPSSKPLIWLHSVSVGETRAMQKMVELITLNLPNYQILITTMTPTGRLTAQQLYPQALVHYIPYDISYAVKQFYQIFKPRLGIIMETEIWPNLIYWASNFSIPLYLVNARLSERSYRGYLRFRWAIMPILNQFSAILCQDHNSAQHFSQLGYQQPLETIGNTKFDLVIPLSTNSLIQSFQQWLAGRKIICFASTRDGEEELILDNLNLLTNVLYVFIPRHPERFSVVEELLIQRKISYQKRSQFQAIASTTQVLIGDSMGEMLAYYAVSYLAVIGGSFVECGGQNPIEAIFMGTPVVFGSSMFNFKQVAADCLSEGCAHQLTQINQLNNCLVDLLNDEAYYMNLKNNCNQFINKYQGASLKAFNYFSANLV